MLVFLIGLFFIFTLIDVQAANAERSDQQILRRNLSLALAHFSRGDQRRGCELLWARDLVLLPYFDNRIGFKAGSGIVPDGVGVVSGPNGIQQELTLSPIATISYAVEAVSFQAPAKADRKLNFIPDSRSSVAGAPTSEHPTVFNMDSSTPVTAVSAKGRLDLKLPLGNLSVFSRTGLLTDQYTMLAPAEVTRDTKPGSGKEKNAAFSHTFGVKVSSEVTVGPISPKLTLVAEETFLRDNLFGTSDIQDGTNVSASFSLPFNDRFTLSGSTQYILETDSTSLRTDELGVSRTVAGIDIGVGGTVEEYTDPNYSFSSLTTTYLASAGTDFNDTYVVLSLARSDEDTSYGESTRGYEIGISAYLEGTYLAASVGRDSVIYDRRRHKEISVSLNGAYTYEMGLDLVAAYERTFGADQGEPGRLSLGADWTSGETIRSLEVVGTDDFSPSGIGLIMRVRKKF